MKKSDRALGQTRCHKIAKPAILGNTGLQLCDRKYGQAFNCRTYQALVKVDLSSYAFAGWRGRT